MTEIQDVMELMEQELRDVGYEGFLLKYLGYVPHEVAAQEVQEASVEFATSLRYCVENLGIVDIQGALESSFMHGFFVALAWRAKQPA